MLISLDRPEHGCPLELGIEKIETLVPGPQREVEVMVPEGESVGAEQR